MQTGDRAYIVSQSARLCRTVARASRVVNETTRCLDPQESETPEPINIKFNMGDHVGDLTPHAFFCISTLKGDGSVHA